jgi:hypothetical protein
VKEILDKELDTLTGSLKQKLFKTAVPLNVKSSYVRVQEVWFMNVLLKGLFVNYEYSSRL